MNARECLSRGHFFKGVCICPCEACTTTVGDGVVCTCAACPPDLCGCKTKPATLRAGAR